MARMPYAKHQKLQWLTPEELAELGYTRDSLGRIRKGNLFVCCVSGRFHDQYLNPWPDFDHTTDDTALIFIDDEQIRQFARELIEKANQLAGSTVGIHVGILFQGALGMLWRYLKRKVGF